MLHKEPRSLEKAGPRGYGRAVFRPDESRRFMADLPRAAAASAEAGHNEFGAMPHWALEDLYPAVDSPELTRDLAWAKAEAKAFEADYKGKLEATAKAGKLHE